MRFISETGRHQLLIVAVAGIVFFTNLGGPRLWDRDEPRNAGCAAEMMARGDWIVPVFNAELRDAKPVLLYWFIMAAYAVFGVGEFAARFWSALLGLGTVLMTYHIGRRLFDPASAVWGALVLATTLMFCVAARAATPDAVLIFFSTSSLAVYVMGTFRAKDSQDEAGPVRLREPGRYFPSDWRYVVGMYGLMGIAILAKGPVGLLLPTAVIGMFCLIIRLPVRPPEVATTGRWPRFVRVIKSMLRPFAPGHFFRTCYSMRLLTATLVALAVALPWYVWVGVRTDGQWLRAFFLEENIGRALKPMENHGGPPFYYLLAVMVGFFPWSILLMPALISAVRRIRANGPWRSGYVFMLCWAGVYVVLFSLARTKLPSYVTPMYPALALVTGSLVRHWLQNATEISPRWLRGGLIVWVLTGPAAVVGVYFAARRFLPGDEWLGAVGLILTVGAILCMALLKHDRKQAAAVTLAVTTTVFCTALFGFASLRVDRHQQNHELLAAAAQFSPQPRLGALGALEPSLVFYGGQRIEKLIRQRPVTSTSRRPLPGAWTPEGQSQSRSDVVTFLADDPDAFVITTDRYFNEIRPHLPPDVEVLVDVPYFLKKHRLVLLGQKRALRTARRESASGSLQ